MKTHLASIIGLSCLLGGCATEPVAHTYTVITDPVDAHVQLHVTSFKGEDRVIAESDTHNHKVEFQVVRAPEDSLYVTATTTAAGYEQRPQVKWPLSDELRIEFSETFEAREKRLETENQKAREEYVKLVPSLKPEIREAILTGKFEVGMNRLDADAAVGIGKMSVVSTSQGIGPDLDIYSYNDGLSKIYLFFRNDSLVRWSSTPNF